MRFALFVCAVALALVGGIAAPAHAETSTYECSGTVDIVCRTPLDKPCTIWYNGECAVGPPNHLE